MLVFAILVLPAYPPTLQIRRMVDAWGTAQRKAVPEPTQGFNVLLSFPDVLPDPTYRHE